MQLLHGGDEYADSGASEAPKSSMLPATPLYPAPEPSAVKVTVLPVALSHAAAHSASSGATSVDPSPTSFADADAPAALRPSTQPASAVAAPTLANLFKSKASSFL